VQKQAVFNFSVYRISGLWGTKKTYARVKCRVRTSRSRVSHESLIKTPRREEGGEKWGPSRLQVRSQNSR